MMAKHEFYADPTVFDHWQTSAESWIAGRVAQLAPYSWFAAFAGLASLCLLVALGVFASLLQYPFGGQPAGTWNQLIAQGITLMAALLAARYLLQQGLLALPDQALLSPALRALSGLPGLPAPGNRTRRLAAHDAARPVAGRGSAPGLQEFFVGLRTSGVNVNVARALVSAGIRSPQQLLAYDDAQLLKVRGIGPATLRKLRNHFERT